MVANLFGVLFLISIIVLLYMAFRNHNNIDIRFWSIVVIIPIIIFGYMVKARATNIAEAKLAFCMIYLDSTIMLALVLFSLLKCLAIEVKPWIKVAVYLVSFLHYLSICACQTNELYYATFEIEETAIGTVTKMTDGPIKFTHYIYLGVMLIAIILVPVIAYFKKKDSSKKTIAVYSFFSISGVLIYVIEMLVDVNFTCLPVLYVLGDIAIAINYDSAHSHDMDCVVVEQKENDSRRGYVAFSKKRELLCYNNNAIFFVPEIKGKRIDAVFENGEGRLREVFYAVIDTFDKEGRASADFTIDNTIFRCIVTYFFIRKVGKPSGYLVEIQDVTAEQGYMNLIKEYGESLQREVISQTEHIKYIQQKVVLGMATIIENRDMNTGGHVKRTSDVIKILVDEMRRQGIGDLDDKYADEIIRSAPMHDLGKISIDNKILCKPGKLDDDEYAIMKTHSAKSGEIVKAILSGVEEKSFVQTAFCLARFHHERWDGKGYPERLAEYEIPLEARIMAVADVYDALVSKRCYKEAMSFDKAAEIMVEGMGSQFDPMMKPIFEACREQLEAYYIENSRE